MAVTYDRLAKREEADMVKEYGGEYRAYMERTRRFIPYRDQFEAASGVPKRLFAGV